MMKQNYWIKSWVIYHVSQVETIATSVTAVTSKKHPSENCSLKTSDSFLLKLFQKNHLQINSPILKYPVNIILVLKDFYP